MEITNCIFELARVDNSRRTDCRVSIINNNFDRVKKCRVCIFCAGQFYSVYLVHSLYIDTYIRSKIYYNIYLYIMATIAVMLFQKGTNRKTNE